MYYIKINDEKYELNNNNTKLKTNCIILSNDKNKITLIKVINSSTKLYNIFDENNNIIDTININEINRYISDTSIKEETKDNTKEEEVNYILEEDELLYAYYGNTIGLNELIGERSNFRILKDDIGLLKAYNDNTKKIKFKVINYSTDVDNVKLEMDNIANTVDGYYVDIQKQDYSKALKYHVPSNITGQILVKITWNLHVVIE